MATFDPRTPFRLDRFLDALVDDSAPPPDSERLSPGLRRTATTCHRLTTPRHRDQIVDLTSRSVPTIMSIASRERIQPRPVVPQGRLGSLLHSRPMTALATAVLVAVVLLSGAWALTRSTDRLSTGSAVDYQLLVILEGSDALRAIDPETLADLPAQPVLSSSPMASPGPEPEEPMSTWWAVSADGSTLARVEGPTTQWTRRFEVTIFDSRTARKRARFTLSLDYFGLLQLSNDGTRLAVQVEGGQVVNPVPAAVNDNTPPKWNVYDPATGHLLSTIDGSGDGDPVGARSGWLSPDGLRFFRFAIDLDSTYPGPWPVQLVVHDATNGTELARIDVPDVRIGYWPTDLPVDMTRCFFNTEGTPISSPFTEGRVWRYEIPGVALSPDGRRMAIVHPDGRRLTMLDLTALAAGPTVEIGGEAQDQSTPVQIQIGDSQCASDVGRIRRATFSFDGTQLYVSGVDATIEGDGRQALRLLGLVRIDVAAGRVVARMPMTAATAPYIVNDPIPSPDGRYLYLAAYYPGDEHVELWRLDAETLNVLAERRFDHIAGIAVVASPT